MSNFSWKHKQHERLERVKIRRSFIGYFLVAPALLYLLLLTFYPLFRTVQMSFTDVTAAQWHFVGLQHYRALLRDPWFWNSVGVVGIFAIPAMIMHLLVGLGLALLLNEAWLSETLRSLMRGLLIFTLGLFYGGIRSRLDPAAASAGSSELSAARDIGPFRAHCIPGRARPGHGLTDRCEHLACLPFFMIIILGGLQAIPPELYEAAKVDGANVLQRFRYVTLPQLRRSCSP